MNNPSKSVPSSGKSAWVITAAAFCLISLTACNREQPKAAAGPPDVLVTQVAQRDVPITREWLGSLDGSTNVEIRAHVTGYITEQKYTDGSAVKKGDVLFLIDPRPFVAQLAEAKAQQGQAEAQQGKSAAELQKQTDLYNKKVTSQREFDDATQNNLANIANVDAAKAAVQQAQLNLDFTKITAPIDGIAGIAQIGIGDLVGQSSGALTTISTVDPIKAKFPLSEQEYLRFAKDLNELMNSPVDERKARAELILANGDTYPEKGKFSTFGRQVDVRTGTIPIELLFPNAGGILRPGQYAKVRVVIETQKNALLVPQRAVTEMQGSYSIAVMGADGKAEIRPVQVGEVVGSWWVIDKGLNPGEQVIVDGIQKVRAGMPVNAKPWTPPAEAPVANAQPEAK